MIIPNQSINKYLNKNGKYDIDQSDIIRKFYKNVKKEQPPNRNYSNERKSNLGRRLINSIFKNSLS